MQIVNDKKFDRIKEDYCPQCYFEDDVQVPRTECKHNCKACKAEKEYSGKSKLHTCGKVN